MRLFVSLLVCESHQLGMDPLPFQPGDDVTVGPLCGSGLVSAVYEAAVGTNANAVIKLFPASELEVARREFEILQTLARAKVPFICQAIRLFSPGSAAAGALCLVPRGDIFTAHTVKLQHVAEILQSLKGIHENSFVHQDIRPSNLLLDRSGHALVIDFHLGANIGVPFHGSHRFGPEMALKQTVATHPSHDLESLVKTLHAILYGSDKDVNRIPSDDTRAIMSFWEARLSARVWQQALGAARSADYNGVLSALTDFLG